MWPEGSSEHRIGVIDFHETPRQPNANGEYVVTASIVKVGGIDRPGGIYYWSVAVMREVDGKTLDVSSEAEPHRLIYDAGSRDSGSSGGGSGGGGGGGGFHPPPP
jgi:uncharacterized membrane protein YgcG